MIPAVLPPPRTDRAVGPAATAEDGRFDDALLRAVDTNGPDNSPHGEEAIDGEGEGATVESDGVESPENRPREGADDERDEADPGHGSSQHEPTAVPVSAPPVSPPHDSTPRPAAGDARTIETMASPSASPAAEEATTVGTDGLGHEPLSPDVEPGSGIAGVEQDADTVTTEVTAPEETASDLPADEVPAPAAPADGDTTELPADLGTDGDAAVDAGDGGAQQTGPERIGPERTGPRAGRDTDAPGRAAPSAQPAPRSPAPHGGVVDAPSATAAAPPTVGTTSAPAPPAPTTGPHPPVAQQVVDHVTPLLDGPDGTHELTIELRPATLGRVQLEVTLDDGVLHVRVTADDPGSRRLLAQAMDDLRAVLTDAGIATGDIDVGDPRAGDWSRSDHHDDPSGRGGAGTPTTAHPPATRPRAPLDARSALDVLL